MEIKTTEELKELINNLIDRSGNFNNKLSEWDKQWISVESLKEWVNEWSPKTMHDLALLDKLNELVNI